MQKSYIMSMDAGGTMTDVFFVDRDGKFVVGKAQTTPDDESEGFAHSCADALKQWGKTPEQVFPEVITGIYSGTSMLNRLLERKGQNLGVIVTAGQEDYFRLERGIQTYLGYSYQDRLKVVTHRHNEPIVPRSQMTGVRGRIDCFGNEAIPLYENEVRDAVRKLIAAKVQGIVVNLLYSYANSAHEQRVREIALEEMAEAGVEIPTYLSSDLYPVMQDFARLNTVAVEAYAAEPSRGQFRRIADRVQNFGGDTQLRVMASHGGTISIDAKELARTLISGPIGGMVGARYIADKLGEKNIVCSDIGGTSFDLGLITDGEFTMKAQPDMARFMLKLPLIDIDSVGSGTGSYARVNPVSNRIEIGPDSAGSKVGMCNPQASETVPTLSDCNVLLGNLNPYNFLGGDVVLDPDAAYRGIKEHIADPLGLDPYEAAEGVLELFEDHLRNEVFARIFGKGYSPDDYILYGYGGGGPLHVCGYTKGLKFSDVIVPAWAAGFSAFGCACADFEYRIDRTVNAAFPASEIDPAGFEAAFEGYAKPVNAAWAELEKRVADEFDKSGIDSSQVEFKHYARVQYVGQLNDVEVLVDFDRVSGPEDMQQIIDRFEYAYAKAYSRAARSPELGYQTTNVVVTGTVPVEKPELPVEELAGETPPEEARKEGRKVFRGGQWLDADVFDMDKVRPGNRFRAVTILESPATTLVIPPGFEAYLDEHRLFHLKETK
ncbi:hydantoinase/oxoprolinase [Salinisphaera sp. PC39]|uniref:hydantoinase/oxoprolinase family protein n=1 Tax=Salinisphaera sp. PC39 TaxID=1304156 RepID=UPI00333E8C72